MGLFNLLEFMSACKRLKTTFSINLEMKLRLETGL